MPLMIIAIALLILLFVRTGIAGGALIWLVVALCSYWQLMSN